MHRRSCLLVTLLPAGNFFGALYHKLQTQSSAPEDGRNYRPKHVKLIEITNKPILLHLVACLYYCFRDARPHKHQIYILFVFLAYIESGFYRGIVVAWGKDDRGTGIRCPDETFLFPTPSKPTVVSHSDSCKTYITYYTK